MTINNIKGTRTNCARDTDETTHGEGTSRADGRTVLGEGGSQGLVGAILVLNLELVLEELKELLVGLSVAFRSYDLQ